jgi:hypothetical protein
MTEVKKKGRARPKGYYDWKPRRKARELLVQVDAILDEYRDHLPLTVRQIFYRLVGSYGYDKSQKAYKALAENMVLARRARFIPFEAIRDDGVMIYAQRWHNGVEGFWDEVGQQARHYRRDRQLGQPVRIELWAESAGMMPQLDRVAAPYSIPVYSAGGQPSVTANKSIADRIIGRNVPTVMLHVGDYDPSGESIFRTMSADVAAFVRADRIIYNLELIPVRAALTADQVDHYNLPTAPAKGSDSRSKTWKGETCQLEALAPDQLAEVVEGAIQEWVDMDIYQRQVDVEQAERVQLLQALPSGS